MMKYSILTLACVAAQALATPMSQEEIYEWMQRSNGVYSLHEAAVTGDYSAAAARIREGADVNERDEQGYTPLHLAVILGHADTVQQLLEAGADKTLQDRHGKTPADYAKGACAELLRQAE